MLDVFYKYLGVPLRQLRGLRRAVRWFASLRASHRLRRTYHPSRSVVVQISG